MKHLILALVSFTFLTTTSAQTAYETPHVKDGKTMQFTLPTGFFKIENSDYEGNALFTTKEGVSYDDVGIERENIAMLAVLHELTEERSIQQIMDELKSDLIEPNTGLIVLEEPKITKVKGRNCMYAGFKGEMEGEALSGVYFSVIGFGDYNIVIAYYALEGTENLLSYENFKKIIASWNEVETTREDEMGYTIYNDSDISPDEFDDVFETDYNNDLFETQISYYDILPDSGEDWNEPLEDNTHLLSEFTYKENNGSIKVFSGGPFSNYPTSKEMEKAIQLVMDLPTRISIKKDSEFSNEDHFFQLHTINGGGTMTSVYTTIVNDELVFFTVDGGANPVPDFKPAVRDFMLTMWIDYIDESKPQPLPNQER